MRLKFLIALILGVFLSGLPASMVSAGSWNDHQRRLLEFLNKYKAKRDEFKKLVAEKTNLKDSAKLEENLKKIVETHKAANELLENYKNERRHVQYKHPEKVSEIDKKGVPEEMEDLSDVEEKIGLPGKLEAIRVKIQSAYGQFPPKGSGIGGRQPPRPTTTTTTDERPHLKM